MRLKALLSGLFILWMAFVLAAFFAVQKSAALGVLNGLASALFAILLAFLFTFCGAGLGYRLIGLLRLELDATPRLLFASGAGMGLLGLFGFALATAGAARPLVLLLLLVWLVIWLYRTGTALRVWDDIRVLWAELRAGAGPGWIRWLALLAGGLMFVQALAPPVEAFDALLYHLSVPAWWLRDGGLRLVNVPQYWFPSLLEGMFVWPMAFAKDSAPQLIHFVFALLSILLVWDWTRRLWSPRAGWWAIALFLSMPSLPWLATWAYTDLALVFYSLAALYALWEWKKTLQQNHVLLCGLMTGFAMGIKYTSLLLPLAIVALLFWWKRREPAHLGRVVAIMISACVLTALPWYVRNLVWTGNPFYPFAFGGANWDPFRSQWYAGLGTGIGWDPIRLLSLPFVVTLGHQDANYIDGRFGPMFLLLLPLAAWIFWKTKGQKPERGEGLAIIAVFSILSIASWTAGVILSAHLLQARLLWPGIIPLIVPMAAGILEIEQLDTTRLKPSFIFSALAAVTISIFLLDFGLLVVRRNPLLAAVGIESRSSYSSHLQPAYTQALALVDTTPADASIYFLDEPRSYGMTRRVQPDPINDNLPHSLYLHHDVQGVLSAWREAGYTHVLLSERGSMLTAAQSEAAIPGYSMQLAELRRLLEPAGQTEDGDYVLYLIPNP